jgi:hypothetical protein
MEGVSEMRITIKGITAFLAICVASAQAPQQVPRFEDYPVTNIFSGTPAPPILDTSEKRLYRTRIRDGVAKGLGVTRDGVEQPGPNFAGHFILVEWQCGSPCGMMAMVDAVSGRVYSLPLSKGLALPAIGPGDPGECAQWGYALVEFRQNSRLVAVTANPEWKKGANYKHFFLWDGDRWRFLMRVPSCA